MAVEHPACLDDFKVYRCSQFTWRFPIVFSNYQRVHLLVHARWTRISSQIGNPAFLDDVKVDFPWFSMIFPFNYGYFFWADFPMKIHFPMVFPMVFTRKSPRSPSRMMPGDGGSRRSSETPSGTQWLGPQQKQGFPARKPWKTENFITQNLEMGL